MADIVTGTVSGQVDMTAIQNNLSDIRREANSLAATTLAATSAVATDLNRTVDNIAAQQAMAVNLVARDVVDNRAQISALGYQVRDGFAAAAKDSEINALKTQVQLAQQSTYLSDKIDNGNMATRDLLVGFNNADLNRRLIERNNEIVETRGDHRFYGLSNQINALHSNLQAATQGTVNFGSMSGNAGRNTSTNNIV